MAAHLLVTITDTGSGIKPEVRRRLFVEPFFTTKVRHRGLGLAIAYRILCAHRGRYPDRLGAASRHRNSGAGGAAAGRRPPPGSCRGPGTATPCSGSTVSATAVGG